MKKTYTDELRERLGAALSRIEELEMEVADLEMQVDDCIDLDEDPRYMELRDFLSDIGFDPHKLPSSVGERMDIRSRLESPIPDLSQALEECQEQYKYLEEHYDRAFELGYDPITKEFYCRACSRAGRDD